MLLFFCFILFFLFFLFIIFIADRLSGLVDLLKRKSVDESPELVLNIVGMINNISFYGINDNALYERRVEIAGACEMKKYNNIAKCTILCTYWSTQARNGSLQ